MLLSRLPCGQLDSILLWNSERQCRACLWVTSLDGQGRGVFREYWPILISVRLRIAGVGMQVLFPWHPWSTRCTGMVCAKGIWASHPQYLPQWSKIHSSACLSNLSEVRIYITYGPLKHGSAFPLDPEHRMWIISKCKSR